MNDNPISVIMASAVKDLAPNLPTSGMADVNTTLQARPNQIRRDYRSTTVCSGVRQLNRFAFSKFGEVVLRRCKT